MCKEGGSSPSPRSVRGLLDSGALAAEAQPPLPYDGTQQAHSGLISWRRRRAGRGPSLHVSRSAASIDVESQQLKPPTPGGEKPKARRVKRKGRRGRAFDVLYKIARAVLTDVDDETLMREDNDRITIAITLLKEAIIGLLIAFAIVSLVLFIDHRFLLGLPTARNFRRATYHLMDDKETLQTFEEDTGLKLLDEDEYAAMVEEVAKAENWTLLGGSILVQRTNDLENTQADLKRYTDELPELLQKLKLDDYCERCLWNKEPGAFCGISAGIFGRTYQRKEVTEFIQERKRWSCRWLEEKLLSKWDVENDFCPDCTWSGAPDQPNKRGRGKKGRAQQKQGAQSTTCGAKASFLAYRQSINIERAQARIMIESDDRCRRSVHEEEEKLGRFCVQCKYNKRITCGDRGVELMKWNGVTMKKAVLEAMKEEPRCVSGP
ncbi:hypothetical protein ACHAXT_001577 [Thalassiosira profunda]